MMTNPPAKRGDYAKSPYYMLWERPRLAVDVYKRYKKFDYNNNLQSKKHSH